MSSPLTPARASAINSRTPSEQLRLEDYEITKYTTTTTADVDSDGPPSSPFVANVPEFLDSENQSPGKTFTVVSSAAIDHNRTSPLKLLTNRPISTTASKSPQKALGSQRSPRKLSSPEKRFPVNPSSPEKRPAAVERTLSITDMLRDNEGLTKAIEILEDDDSVIHNPQFAADDTFAGMGCAAGRDDGGCNFDDTMASTFSTFSAVPDMTMFAKIGHSPSKLAGMGPTPRRNQIQTPATARRPVNRSQSPTPKGHRYNGSKEEDNTNLLDFTEQLNNFSGAQSVAYETSTTIPVKSSHMQTWATTPSTNRNRISNLLDFDIPPAPTPRSMPTITPRELESLKSSFLSEISSLKASLSGKEAEVHSLKTAVADAEKRVGESMENVREERNLKEQLAAEKEGWEKRGREMEAVLRNVKEEIVHGERDRQDLDGRLEESERRREAAEIMAQEAESKMAAMKAGKVSAASEATDKKDAEFGCGGRAVELAVEKVSRELHTLYKEKHETKVSALKKSYERRWDKKVKDLESQVEDLVKENEELKLGRDTTMTKVEPKNPLQLMQDVEKQAAQDAKTKQLEAELEGLNQEVKSVKKDNADLRTLLEDERVEKGKLVQAVDEMIPLVAAFDDMLANMDQAAANQADDTPRQTRTQPSTVENLRGSISRASGLRAPSSISSIPAAGENRVGRGGFGAPAPLHERSRSGSSSQGQRPGSGLGYRSGIMSSIEKMGSYKGRGE